MLNLRRGKADDAEEATAGTGSTGVPPAPAADSAPIMPPSPAADEEDAEESFRPRMSLFGVGMRVIALVVVGVILIGALAVIGDSRIAHVTDEGDGDRLGLERERVDLFDSLAAVQRAVAITASRLDAAGRQTAKTVAGANAAEADGAERTLTELAQALEPQEAASRAFAAAAGSSIYLKPANADAGDEIKSLIQANRDRAALVLKSAQEMTGKVAELVLDNQAMVGAVRSGDIAAARDRYITRAQPKFEALGSTLDAMQSALVDFSADLQARHAALLKEVDNDTSERADDQRRSIRLQIILLVVIVSAGAVFIALYGLAMPLAELAAVADRYAQGDFDVPALTLGRKDEIGKLSAAMDKLRDGLMNREREREDEARKAREADRLSKLATDRELQQLRRDKDRLERERVERDADAIDSATAAEQLEYALEQERSKLHTEAQAELQRRLEQLNQRHREQQQKNEADIAHLRSELEKALAAPKPAAPPLATDPALTAKLAKAEADLKTAKDQHAEDVERLKQEQEKLKQEQDKLKKDQTVAFEQLRQEQQQERTKHAQELEAAQKRLAPVPQVPAPPPRNDEEIAKLRAQFETERKTMAEALQNERQRASDAIRRLRQRRAQAADLTRDDLVKIRGEFDIERKKLTQALAEAQGRATAAESKAATVETQAKTLSTAESEAKRLAAELNLERQQRADELADLRAEHARSLAELQKRHVEEAGDRLRVIHEMSLQFSDTISGAIGAVQNAANDVKLSLDRINDAATRTGQRSDAVASRIDHAAASVRQAVMAAEQVAGALGDIGQKALQSSRVAAGAADSARTASSAVRSLQDAAEKIRDALAPVAEIAERTNLLALNASIEAARAGDSGHGFSALAVEVKTLAQRAQRVRSDLNVRIQQLEANGGAAVDAVATLAKSIDEIDSLSGATARSIEAQGIPARAAVLGVHAAAEGTEGLSRSVSEASATIIDATRITAQLSEAATAMTANAGMLRQQIADFVAAIRAS